MLLSSLDCRYATSSLSLLVVLLLGPCCGCAATRSDSSGGSDRSLITREELAEPPAYANAYNAVENLRPQWLITRGDVSPNSNNPISVYVDGARYGPVSTLRDINVGNIASMSFLKAAEATARYGRGNENGVIEVRTRSGEEAGPRE
jgi:hypothetical protein